MLYDFRLKTECKKARAKLEKCIEQKKVVELKAKNKKRTVSQNSYIHVCFSIFAIEQGWTLQEAKVVIKREYGMIYEKNGFKFVRSTADLSVDEMTKFTEWLLIWAATKHDIFIPSPAEYLANSVVTDKEIAKFEEYLESKE